MTTQIDEARFYGVSFGNGNDGVSHLFPDYYVKTSEPYKLALGAMLDQFKPEFMEQAYEAIDIDGEAEFTIYASILDPLDDEPAEEGESWSYHNGAWMICDVFPIDERDVAGKANVYDSIEEALSKPAFSLASKS